MSFSDRFHIGYNIISTLICVCICIIQIMAALCHWHKYPWNKDTSFVLFLIFIIFITNILCCLFGLSLTFAIPSCNICSYGGIIIQILYSTNKLSTYLFYLQRAKLAQTFQPKIPYYCFNKIFPCFYIIIYLIFLSLFIFKSDAADTGYCSKENEINIQIPFLSLIDANKYYLKQWCYLNTSSSKFYIISGIFIEVISTLFFTYLFSSPLISLLKPIINNTNNQNNDYDQSLLDKNYWSNPNILNSAKYQNNINNTDDININNSMMLITKENNNTNDIDKPLDIQQNEIKKILIYNIILSLIGFIFSSLTMVAWPNDPQYFWYIPWSDYMINSITTFLMLGRNRKFLNELSKYICCYRCCCKWRKCRKFKIYNTNNNKNNKHKRNGNKHRNKMKFKQQFTTYHSSDDEEFSSTKDYYHNINLSQTDHTSTQNSVNHNEIHDSC